MLFVVRVFLFVCCCFFVIVVVVVVVFVSLFVLFVVLFLGGGVHLRHRYGRLIKLILAL